jgi:hypothetical protein
MDRREELLRLTSQLQVARRQQAEACRNIDTLEEQLTRERETLHNLNEVHRELLEQVILVKSEMLAAYERKVKR